MPQRGKFTTADAAKAGLVAAAPVARVIEKWALEHWYLDAHAENQKGLFGTTVAIANATGMHCDTIGKVREGKKAWLEFDNADRIVCFIDPLLWRTDTELSDIYQSYDFSNLDVHRPTCREADPLRLLDGLSCAQAAVVLGLSKSVVDRQRRKRLAA